MNVSALAGAPFAVQFHLATVVPAFVIGTWLIFASVKGSGPHRAMGAAYLSLMALTALSTLFIRSGGGFSLLHLLIPVTAASIAGALWAVRRGNIRGHRNAMLGLYIGGLLIAGAFALTPGRLLYRVFFG